ncbi:MAG: AAA family ATPase [Flavobacteriales bacterium]
MQKPDNPFSIKGYYGPEYFCDREKELARILSAVKNNRNLVLISPRRMGKTGLIRHAAHSLVRRKVPVFFVDIYGSNSMHELVQLLAKHVLGKLDNKPERLLLSLKNTFGSLRPAIEFDQFSGAPSITFDIQRREAKTSTLEKILNYVEARKQRVVIALDEFQQVTKYKEKNAEALLRSIIQHCNYTHFIFSGSHQSIMTSMFGLPNRPFYNSAEMLELQPVPVEAYAAFIQLHFKSARKQMPLPTAKLIVELGREHTYYIQHLCNKLFTLPLKSYDEQVVRKTLGELLSENEGTFYNYRNLMTDNQWKLVRAIAKEEGVKRLTGAEFLQKHHLGSSSSVQRSAKALMDAEFIFQWRGVYHVYDQFFAQWMAHKF